MIPKNVEHILKKNVSSSSLPTRYTSGSILNRFTRIRRSVDTPFVLLSTASTWGTHHITHGFRHDFPNQIASPFRLRAAFA